MALRDIFKRDKLSKKEKKEEKRIKETSSTARPAKEKPEKEKKELDNEQKSLSSEARVGRANEVWRILKSAHNTEKATSLTKQNQYVFEVFPKSNKIEIKKAIESLYGVEVVSVKTVNIPSKRRRVGRIKGWKRGYKKAIVKIKEGQKIELLPR